MAKEEMMPYMTAYNKGYVPPKGSAGSDAFGKYAFKKNPLPKPMRGSQITGESEFGRNADRMKAMKSKEEEAKKESLRGYGC